MSDISTLVNGLNLTDAQIQQLVDNLTTLKSAKLLELDSDIARTKEGMRLTVNGHDMLAKAVAGQKLTFTRVAFGDSILNGEVYTPNEYWTVHRTALVNEREISLPLVDVKFAGNGCALVKFQIDNSNLTTGFWAREIGLFAKVGSEAEKLYSYKNVGVLANYIVAGGGAVATNLIVSLVTVIDEATNVTAVVDASLLNVTAAEFSAHVNSATPHPNVPNKSSALTTSTSFWATGSDNQLHPISADNLSAQILGGNLNQISVLNSRIAQNEVNIANLYMQLDSTAAMGLDANLLIAEDFIDCRAVDSFYVKVDDEAAGAQNVCVEDADGILEGHYYTISDGVRSQIVQVTSVAKNDNLFVVFFAEPLSYTFDLSKTYLYRTTATLGNGGSGGSGDVQDTTYDFSSTVYTGESSTASKALTLATNLKNADKFTLSGDYDFTTDNCFTIAS
ncbi:MAG: phage tail protein [Selenomonadaceae bacterium]|nr:phage tail protein [Selenomonadaceae bacterium]